ncbi:hypothetical protein [Actinoplanes sp. L3-i22]|uniref:hypothetical protein n=1 Tax=Actinoplanes sp. L3-i22 TaxID=2836373 RepID=UPI001C79602C|nr:hypothetical protein [Actinoplanes sp. L3-i22]BCY08927.1 hypothetical protein L3i22_040150 [Actinoplanes sp. L3-i22]
MGQLAAQLGRISVDVASPDGRLRAGVHGRLQLRLEFRDRSYGTYDDAELGQQLGRLATLAWARYHREYTEIEAAYLDGYEPDRDASDQGFEQEARELTVTGVSPGGWVGITSRALATWTVTIRGGAQRQLAQERFISEAMAAATATIGAYRSSRAQLLDRYYDLSASLPPWRRGVTAGNRRWERR